MVANRDAAAFAGGAIVAAVVPAVVAMATVVAVPAVVPTVVAMTTGVDVDGKTVVEAGAQRQNADRGNAHDDELFHCLTDGLRLIRIMFGTDNYLSHLTKKVKKKNN